ncbi:PQQ-binding-like beta-propeller repeat protein [Actinoplanes sp. NPDC026619]|uniref:outer membrane protein assembly factor BamB family protein n=1 Tax=Actinoplanes sp. NPDC026619 TaxID=3155798 RepID=UPI00340C7B53
MIDLGEVTEDTAPPPMPVNLPRLRRVVLAALAVVGVLALAGSAGATPAGVRQLWSTPLRPGEAWSLSADTVYMTRLGNKVSAYNLTTGELRWSVPAGADVGDRGASAAGNILLVPADLDAVTEQNPDGGQNFYESVGTTIALDTATGAERWRTNGEVYAYADPGVALVAEDDTPGSTSRLRLVRLADGAEIWNHPTPGVASWTAIQDGDRLTSVATVTKGGLLSVYDDATGALRHTAQLPRVGAGKPSDTLIAAGDYLTVIRDQVIDTTTTVYRADDLQPLWRTPEHAGYVTTCGDLLCSIGPLGITGHDPRTGTEKWQMPDGADLWMIGHDRMLVSSGALEGESSMADPATGAKIGGPFTGRMAYPLDRGLVPMYLRPALEPRDRYAVVRVDPDHGSQRTVGTVPIVTIDDFCMTTGDYLACARAGSALDITVVD